MIPLMSMDRPLMAMASACAHADFRRARRGHLTARARRRLRRTRPRDLADAASLHWQPARRRAIPLAAIVGTVEPTADFDASFQPASERVAPRWQSIARAHHDGRDLPPIDVIEQHHAMVFLERRRHETPHVLVAPEPVREDHRPALQAPGHLHVVAAENVHAQRAYEPPRRSSSPRGSGSLAPASRVPLRRAALRHDRTYHRRVRTPPIHSPQ